MSKLFSDFRYWLGYKIESALWFLLDLWHGLTGLDPDDYRE